MNEVARRDEPGYISVPRADREAEDVLRFLISGSHREAGALQLLRLPTDAQRDKLQARQRYLTSMMKVDKDQNGLLVTQMLRGYRARSTGEGSGLRLAEDVKLFLRELALEPACPTWAVSLVCGSIRLGQMEGVKPGQEPSTAQLRRLVDVKAWPVKAELLLIHEVLNGKKWLPGITDDVKQQVHESFVALHAEMLERLKEPEPDAPTPMDQLVAMAGGVDAWSQIPDAKARMANAMALGEHVDRVAKGAKILDENLVGAAAGHKRKRPQKASQEQARK